MKRYHTVIRSDGSKHTYVNVFEPTNREGCSVCQAMNTFPLYVAVREVEYAAGKMPKEEVIGLRRSVGLCRGNLKAHLASGKHWKHVNGYWKEG